MNINDFFPNTMTKISDEIGIGKLFDNNSFLNVWKMPKFPPYNIIKTGENSYVIELAIAGFTKDQIEITLNNGELTVVGKKNSETQETQNYYLFKNIAERAFQTRFSLNNLIEVKNAELSNGMLKIWLDSIVTEDKTKKIPINEPKTSTKEFLVETEKGE